MARWQSIERKLPILIAGLLFAVVAAFSWAGYRQLERALVTAAGERLEGVSRQLAGLLGQQVVELQVDVSRVAADAAIRRYLIAPDGVAGAPARASLGPLASDDDVVAAELWAAGGERVLVVEGPAAEPAWAEAAAPPAPDSGEFRIGPIGGVGDLAYYTVIAPVPADSPGVVLGTVVQRRRFSGTRSAALISDLIGSNAAFLIGNASGAGWTDLDRVRTGPPTEVIRDGSAPYTAADGTEHLGAAARVAGTPWVVWVEFPRSAVLAPARRYLQRLVGTALVFVIIGGLGAWLLSRGITHPLRKVTYGAERISAGDYAHRVAVTRRDEFGRLSAAFNHMAERVEDAQHNLEDQVAARTRELEGALQRLETAQAQLVEREKLATLGQLASGVGHELRNPLGVMTNALYLLDAVLDDAPEKAKEYLGILRAQVGLSEKIVGDLLDFARIKPPQAHPVALEPLVDAQLERLGPLDGIALERDFPAVLPPARADSFQLGQVVLNLLTNAVQAMPEGGKLTLRGRHDAPGRVRLEVSDTGPGIPADNVERVFEPLFTTKARGIGLGLAVSRALARANGGDISVESEPGKGAIFAVVLPVPAHEPAR